MGTFSFQFPDRGLITGKNRVLAFLTCLNHVLFELFIKMEYFLMLRVVRDSAIGSEWTPLFLLALVFLFHGRNILFSPSSLSPARELATALIKRRDPF